VHPDEYHRLRDEIVQKLKALKDPDTGETIVGNLFLKEEVYHGPLAGDGPDIIYLPMERTYLPVSLFGFGSSRCITENFLLPGNHHLHGVLIASGQFIEPGRLIQGASIMDLAPTILYLMGGKIPRDMDGKVLQEIVAAEFRQANAVEFMDGSDDTPESADALSEADRQDLIAKLEELGYL
jgi:predicted AlkP superfamily phosphohydrolase/phosphomutase